MKISFIEHDTYVGPTNLDIWAEKYGHQLNRTFLCDGEPFPTPDQYDWLILSGAFQHVWDDEKFDWLGPEKIAVKEALDKNKVIVGLCFGAQLIADAFDAGVYTAEKKEIGWHRVSLNNFGRDTMIFEGVPDKFTTFHWHSDHYYLPAGCTNMAYSSITPHQSFICDEKPVVAFQFHPEYTREMVRQYAEEFGHEWSPGPHVQGQEEVLAKTESLPDTFWLFEPLFNNIKKMYGPK